MIASRPLISVVIPVGPNDFTWQHLLQQLNRNAQFAQRIEVILVVGEKSPMNVHHLLNFPLKIVKSTMGRAQQQNAGAARATADTVWFLHADSEVSATTLAHAVTFSQSPASQNSLAYFKLRFAEDSPQLMPLNAAGANIRSTLFDLPFGDQGLLMAKSIWQKVGLFDENLALGEDLDWVVRAKLLSVNLRCLPATLATSARKYQRNGWLNTTIKHIMATIQLATEAKKRFHSKKTACIAIFVKTPGLSPIKTRLAHHIGKEKAEQFHRYAAKSVASVCLQLVPQERVPQGVDVYYAVAEPASSETNAQRINVEWPELPHLFQGEGGLGERMWRIYAELLTQYTQVFLIGADVPQIEKEHLVDMLCWLKQENNRFALAPSADGGFWCIGGNTEIPLAQWQAVKYSQSSTLAELVEHISTFGTVKLFQSKIDVDEFTDLIEINHELNRLASPTEPQLKLAELIQCWLAE